MVPPTGQRGMEQAEASRLAATTANSSTRRFIARNVRRTGAAGYGRIGLQ
ncbi:MAG TPA: hypothetical protein VK936_15635 [Longimicrobiales bacterium]|nr:hypothetical protein [Longimicrobiales bacterium]